MIPKSTSYQAYCLECCGGGKKLGQPSSKKLASREATSHIKVYGHKVTLLYKSCRAGIIRPVDIK